MKKRSAKASRFFGAAIALCLTLGMLLPGCGNGEQAESTAQTDETTQDEENKETAEMMDIIKDLYVDKSRYDPGEKPVLTVEMAAEETSQLELTVNVTYLTQVVYTVSEELTLGAGETVEKTFTMVLPEEDFTAYAVEVYLVKDGACVDMDMTAAEVASDWSKYPRYGYLTKYGEQSDETVQETLERLSKHHITGLFYYDVLDRHDKPLAGTVESPDSGWYTLANSYASASTVQRLIDYGHEYNMNSYLYNLIFGAYQGYDQLGVDYKWGLFKSSDGTSQDAHGQLPDSWETQWIYLFNPADTGWQDYYLGVTADVLEVYNYDGIQVDSLGGRGTVYDYYGNVVDLADAYVPLLNRLVSELDTRVIFNPVSGYGMTEMLESVDYDIVYEEIWPSDASSYSSLKSAIDYIRNRTDEDKGVVIAAYMNYDKSDGAFNTPGVLLTDAVIMASGASHLELGDTGMLSSEYYPGDTLRISDALAEALRNYCSFGVAYENYLRDPSFKEVVIRTYINDTAAALDASLDRIWSFTKKNDDGDQVIHFINLIGASSLEWVDSYGKQTAPEEQTDLVVRQYVDAVPSQVLLASPDQNEGIMTSLDFQVGEDEQGTYVTFTMPKLAYWNMVIIKQ